MTPESTEPAALGSRFDSVMDAAVAGDPEACLQLGQHYLQENEFGRARRWLSRAARSGSGPAMVELGRLELVRTPVEAAEQFHRATETGCPEGHYEYATVLYRGYGVSRDRERAAQHLTRASAQGHAGALRTRGFIYAEAGDERLATRCFLMAAQRGDVIACSVASGRLAAGTGIAPDARSAGLLAAAARAGGSYCQEQFYDRWKGVSEQEPRPEWTDDPALLDPVVFPEIARRTPERPVEGRLLEVYDHILSREECDYLIETAAPHLMPSYVRDPGTGKPVKDSNRTSHGWSFHPSQEDIAILRIKERLTCQAGLPVDQAEPFALLRYRHGQEYKPHFDWIAGLSEEARRELERHGQRQRTVFSYLRDVEAGGETEFPRLDCRIAPQAGRAVHFSNVDERGEPDDLSLHASLPVLRGEKWLATLWIRERPLQH